MNSTAGRFHPAGLTDLDPRLTAEEMLAQAAEPKVRWSMRRILESPEGR
jgi:hypothetical protein